MKNVNFIANICVLVLLMLSTSAGFAQTDFWVQTSGPSGGVIYSLTSTPEGNIYAGTDLTGIVYKSTDYGSSWTAVDSGFDPYSNVQALLAKPNGYIFAGSTDGVYRTTNEGISWEKIALVGSAISSFAMDSSGNILAGGNLGQIYKSTDEGLTWRNIDSLERDMQGQTIWALAVNSSGHIFAALASEYSEYFGGVYRTTNDGADWNAWDQGRFSTGVRSLAIAPDGGVYAGTLLSGVYRSTNNGTAWNKTMLSDTGIYSMAVNPNGKIFAGACNIGIYYTTDNGDDWIKDSTGLTNRAVYSLMVNPAGYVFVGTNGSGVFRSEKTTSAGRPEYSVPLSYQLHQNYPNPFNPSTNIGYTLKEEAYVSLKVYNLLGTEVSQIVNESQKPGYHVVRWDARGMASGLYFCQLEIKGKSGEAPPTVLVRKMALIR